MVNKKEIIKNECISIIVPCYNEEESLPIFYEKTTEVLKQLKQDYELILVDDGSKDNTLQVMKDLSEKDNKVFYYSFSRNFGKESAMYAGLCNSRGDYVTIMDADMQDPPTILPKMVDILRQGEYDSVATRRVSRTGEPKVRSFCARLFYKIINKISDANIVDGARDFRLMKKDMVDSVIAMSESNRFSKGIFSWVGYKTFWIEYENVDRVAGTTSWSFWGLVKYALDGIVSFSNAPLDLTTLLGLLTTFFAFIYLLFIIIKYAIYGDPVQGWPTITCLILIIGGIQLTCLGIIGQYIGKMYLEVKKRPHYIVDQSNGKNVKKLH